MASELARRLRRFLGASVLDLRSCSRPGDRLWLALGRAGRLVSYPVNALGLRYAKRELMNPHWLVLRDILMDSGDGVFHCRRRTGDFGIASSMHEPEHRAHFEISSGIFVDVGANIGRYTVMVARKLGPQGKVIAIEPAPDSFRMLCRNIEANGLSNVVPCQVACADADRPVRLSRHAWTSGFDTTRDIGEEEFRWSRFAGELWVQGRRLDSLLESLGVGEVRLLKIDVEGAEMAVLEGAVATLARSPALRIVFEAWSEEPITFLGSHGFRLKKISRSDRNVDLVAERVLGPQVMAWKHRV